MMLSRNYTLIYAWLASFLKGASVSKRIFASDSSMVLRESEGEIEGAAADVMAGCRA